MIPKDSLSNREKIYTADGKACFGKVYSCTDTPPGKSLQVLLSLYTATKPIMKSPTARNNRNKICRKGKTLCVIGAVAGSDRKEYLVFSEDTWVFKREWAELKSFVIPVGVSLEKVEVIKTGTVRCKTNRTTEKQRCQQQSQQGTDCAYAVQLTNDQRSIVWLTRGGMHYLEEQADALNEIGLLPQKMLPRCLFPCWTQSDDILPCSLPGQDCLTESTERNRTSTAIDEDDYNNDNDRVATQKLESSFTEPWCANSTLEKSTSLEKLEPALMPYNPPSPPPFSSVTNKDLQDLSLGSCLSDTSDPFFFPYT